MFMRLRIAIGPIMFILRQPFLRRCLASPKMDRGRQIETFLGKPMAFSYCYLKLRWLQVLNQNWLIPWPIQYNRPEIHGIGQI